MSKPLPYTQLHKTRVASLSDILPLRFPISLHIEPTNICNFKCRSCPHSLKTYDEEVGYYEFMDFDLYRKIVDEIAVEGGVKALKLFNYGESLLHPGLPEMIEYAKKNKAADRIEITSNMSRINRGLAEKLILSGLDYLRISIYGLKDDAHSSFTQTKVPVDHIFRNIRMFRELRDGLGFTSPWMYIKMFDITDPDELSSFKQMYGSLADEIAVEVIHNMSGVSNIEDRLEFDIHVDKKPRNICPQPFYQAAIGANGDVTICCIDWSFSSKVGNVRSNSLKDIWNGANCFMVCRLNSQVVNLAPGAVQLPTI